MNGDSTQSFPGEFLDGQDARFDEPPRFSSRMQQEDEAEAEEAAVSPEDEGYAAGEEHEALRAFGVSGGVDPTLLEAKAAIEAMLIRQGERAAGAVSIEAFTDGGAIQGVAVGEGIPDGTPGVASSVLAPGQAALTVYVAEPTSVDQVKSVLVGPLGVRAAGSDDIPVNVVVTGIIEAQPHRFRARPAPGGVSIGHFKITAGTLGCLARGRRAPRNTRLLVLSNNHVLANSNGGSYGDCICQPGPYDGGRCPQDQIGILERFFPINFNGGVNYVDCATAWVRPGTVRPEEVYLRNGQPQYLRLSSTVVNPVQGMAVGKSGRTTQLTSGRISALGATINVSYGGGRVATFRDQIAIQSPTGNFSQGGDSGSCIWTWQAPYAPVGLLFAGGGNTTFANRMTRVLAALDIGLVV